MSRIPQPDQTPDGPAFEGRLLVRPDDEVVDQGAGFDVATVFTRRRILSLVGVGVGSVALAACGSDSTSASGSSSTTSSSSSSSAASSSSSTSDGEIPDETNGPYPADGTNDVNILTDSGLVRSDITTSIGDDTPVEGVPLTFTFNVVDMANDNAAFAGAALYAWQCDAQGRYSMYTSGVEDETFLRGIQATDADGNLTFTTIVPGCYAGRWPHIHFEVYPDLDSATDHANAIATSQLAFPADMLADVYALDTYPASTENLAGVGTTISDDNIFADSYELETATVKGSAAAGYTGSLTVRIDTTTTPSGGDMGGDMGGGSGGGPGGGPGGGGTPPSGGPGGGGAPPSGGPSGAAYS